MAKASYIQTSFLGGEWSPYAQGRMEKDEYRTAMNVCYNTIPVEQGAAVRRPGTMFLGETRGGVPATIYPYSPSFDQNYTVTFTPGFARVFTHDQVITQTPISIKELSNATPIVATTLDPHGLTTDDQILMIPSDFQPSFVIGFLPGLINRQFRIEVLSPTTFALYDPFTGDPADGATLVSAYLDGVFLAGKIADIPTPYTGDEWNYLRTVQVDASLLIFHHTKPVQVLSPSAGVFAINPADFIDGPYRDPVQGFQVTPSGVTGSITLTASGAIFSASDVDRLVRLRSEPAAWDAGTAYTVGQSVKFNDAYWTATAANSGQQPDINFMSWSVNPDASRWTWGKITAFTSDTVVEFDIKGGDLLYPHAISLWRLGLFTAGFYPICGANAGGRLWLGGADFNRIDASRSNRPFDFSPTTEDGTVADDNAISATLRSDVIDFAYWIVPVAQGVLVGTSTGEWLVSASTLNDPMTPSSITAMRTSRFGVASQEPIVMPMSIAFIQKFDRKIVEYLEDGSRAGRYVGSNLIAKAAHLSGGGVETLAYQREASPTIWANEHGTGRLFGCSYKRDSPYASNEPSYAGWHQHAFSSGRGTYDLTVGPSRGGMVDSLTVVTVK